MLIKGAGGPILFETVTALAPPEAVWKVLTTPATWQKWWGGAIQKVVPGWQEGGQVHWKMGSPSRIEKCVSPETLLLIGDSGTKTGFTLKAGEKAGTTEISYMESYASSRLGIAESAAAEARVRSTLAKLMSCAEIEAVRPSPAVAAEGPSAEKKWWQFWKPAA